ncbi:unnamed protein product, partial [Durusdinium trenchii]
NARFDKLRAAAENGSIVPPVDLRYLKKGQPVQDRHGDCARGRIVSFLESVYHGQAETLPDVRDNIVDVDMKVIDVQVVADPYVDALNAANPATELPSKKEGRKQHQRLKNKSVQVNTDRSQFEERFLPPGTMMDYYELMKAAEPDLPPVSFSSFWRTWKSEFTHLKFRAASSHAVCAICLKHKMWIQEMSGHARARTKQRELYSKHLQSQYMDRVEYWTLRSSARLRTSLVVMMIDSCDQAKFCYPRGMVYQSKELASLIRPRAHITAILVHGRVPLGLPNAIAPRNPIPADYKDHILKFIPSLEQYKLYRAAEHLKSWVLDQLVLQPLLDVSALTRGKDTRKDAQAYVARARESITLKAAATAWAHGVPWGEALDIATRTLAKASPKPKALPKRGPRRR